jgi:hypothetical protein
VRRTAVIVLIAAVSGTAVACGGANASPSATRAAHSTPVLHLLAGYPVAVRGTGFKARERVVVTAVGGKRLVRRTTASSRGAFTVSLPGVDAGACTGFSVTAIGNHGSRATFKLSPGVCPKP